MIMAAGAGTRLNPLTAKIPKPMVPVLNMPILELILRHLQEQGINDVIANTHYCADAIHNVFGGNNHLGINFQYVHEKALSGTAGGLKACESFFEDGETFVVVSGDALTDVNINELYKKHKASGALASMALKEVPMEEVHHFGVVVLDDNSRILGFQEKPKREEAKSNLVNTGIYIFETKIFDYIPANTFYDFAKNVFPALMQNSEIMCGFRIDDYWNDIGTLNQYKSSSFELLDIKGEKLIIGEGSIIEDGAITEGYNIMGNNSKIMSGAKIKDCIIWDNVIVENNAVIEGCIIANNVVIKAGTVLPKDSIIPHDVVISSPEDLNKDTVTA
jgi:mannose-1-phosphate guanylyltransferase/mannose-1-phosphate guanylyltransferase/phosphomannomutase